MRSLPRTPHSTVSGSVPHHARMSFSLLAVDICRFPTSLCRSLFSTKTLADKSHFWYVPLCRDAMGIPRCETAPPAGGRKADAGDNDLLPADPHVLRKSGPFSLGNAGSEDAPRRASLQLSLKARPEPPQRVEGEAFSLSEFLSDHNHFKTNPSCLLKPSQLQLPQ